MLLQVMMGYQYVELRSVPLFPESLPWPSIALLMDGIRRRRGTRPARQATPITPAMLARMVRAQPVTPLGLRNLSVCDRLRQNVDCASRDDDEGQ
jgi:hypothetical protein